MNGGLIDGYSRRIDYLRVSLTQRCNYRCFYCMTSSTHAVDDKQTLLTDEEMIRLMGVFSSLGVQKLRLTGGEPLLRKNLPRLIARVHQQSHIEELSLSTNGHYLETQVEALAESGLHRINISLDSLNSDTFARITGVPALNKVLRGIELARDAGISPIKINMVVMQGINDQEIESMLDYALHNQLELRFIETMPIGNAGMDGMQYFYPLEKILTRIRAYGSGEMLPVASGGNGPARYFQFHTGQRVGLINATSQHFCATCNRVRLTAEGELVLCLGHEDRVSLREPLREGASDAELRDIIRGAVARKPERHQFNEKPLQAKAVRMHRLGG